MKIVRFVLFLGLTTGLCWFLSVPHSPVPAVGKLLDPFNGFWQNARSDAFDKSPEMDLPGLEAPAKVVWDERRVPHIFAENDHDLYYLQGFVQASDRLFQMEFQTMAAGGRLSEALGEATLEIDRYNRRKGMLWAAENVLSHLETEHHAREVLKAYADGINAYIGQLSYRDLPFEYKLLNFQPEPWTAIKTVLLLKYMSDMLTGYTRDLEHSNAYAAWGDSIYRMLYPLFPDSTVDPIIPRGTPWDFQPLALDTPESFRPEPISSRFTYPQPDPDNGSNNWAVSGKKTQNGYPILCNDPHLALNLPSIWYEMQLSAPGVNAYGVTLPGAPNVIIGFNENVAWGLTNAARDVLDWYQIEFRDETKKQYRYDGDWRETELRVEEIMVKGGKTVYDSVYYTVHGPIMHDASFNREGKPLNLAMRWAAHEPSNELLAFYKLNRAQSHEDYREALAWFACPGQNFVFAAKDGDIAITQQGRFPAKWPGQGDFVMDGADPKHEWQAWIPADQNPHVRNPVRGFVSSANQHGADESYPYNLTGRYEFYRNRRLNRRLTEMEKITVEDMMALQQDNYHLMAAEALPLMLQHIDRNSLDADGSLLLGILEKWDFYCDADDPAAPIFQEWYDHLYNAIWEDDITLINLPVMYPQDYMTRLTALLDADFIFVDDVKTQGVKEDLRMLVNASFNQAVAALKTWEKENGHACNWAEYKATSVKHLLPPLKPFGRADIQNGGYRGILNATSERHGPSWRMVVELGPEPKAYGVYPGGQSGNPGSPFYDNMIEDWADGKYFELEFLKKDALPQGAGYDIQTMNPEGL